MSGRSRTGVPAFLSADPNAEKALRHAPCPASVMTDTPSTTGQFRYLINRLITEPLSINFKTWISLTEANLAHLNIYCHLTVLSYSNMKKKSINNFIATFWCSHCDSYTRPALTEQWCTVECPIDCQLSPWSPWNQSECTCGNHFGTLNRKS